MMTSKEIVQRTLNFDYPERVARFFKEGQNDFCWTSTQAKTQATDWKKVSEKKWERLDQWGNIWSRIDDTSKGEVEKGVLNVIEDAENYEFPDYSKSEDYLNVKKIASENSDKYIIGGVSGFTFNIARKLLKLDQYLMDLLLEPKLIKVLHDKVDIVVKDMIENYAAAGVDAIMFGEDWGTQDQTLVSPNTWYEEFFPRTKKLCKIAHDAGIKVIMHSCGKIEKIVPGLIDAGIDVLQFDQPTVHGIDNLAAYQKDAKITFWCPVDIQKTLQTKDENIIRSEAREMVEKLWNGRGGFIAGIYQDNASIGLEDKWQEIASDEFIKAGVQSEALATSR